MSKEVMVKQGITHCQTAQRNLIGILREVMREDVLVSLGLNDMKIPQLPYEIPSTDSPLITALKSALNHLYHTEEQLKAYLQFMKCSSSAVSQVVEIMKMSYKLFKLIKNSLVLIENLAQVTGVYQGILTADLASIEEVLQTLTGKATVKQVAARLVSKFEEGKAAVGTLLTVEGDFYGYVNELMKVMPIEVIDVVSDQLNQLKKVFTRDAGDDCLQDMVSFQLVLLNQLEYKNGFKPGVLQEPYLRKLLEMIEVTTEGERQKQLQKRVSKGMLDAQSKFKSGVEPVVTQKDVAEINSQLVLIQASIKRIQDTREQFRELLTKQDDPKLKTVIEAVISSLYHAEKALEAYSKTLNQSGVFKGLIILWYGYKTASCMKQMTRELMRLKVEINQIDLTKLSEDRDVRSVLALAKEEVIPQLLRQLQSVSPQLMTGALQKYGFLAELAKGAVNPIPEIPKLSH